MEAEALPVVSKVVGVFSSYFLNPLIYLLFVIAFLMIVWGAFKYFFVPGDTDARKDGARLLLWGVLGLAIMLSARALVYFVGNTVDDVGFETGPSWNQLRQ